MILAHVLIELPNIVKNTAANFTCARGEPRASCSTLNVHDSYLEGHRTAVDTKEGLVAQQAWVVILEQVRDLYPFGNGTRQKIGMVQAIVRM